MRKVRKRRNRNETWRGSRERKNSEFNSWEWYASQQLSEVKLNYLFHGLWQVRQGKGEEGGGGGKSKSEDKTSISKEQNFEKLEHYTIIYQH